MNKKLISMKRKIRIRTRELDRILKAAGIVTPESVLAKLAGSGNTLLAGYKRHHKYGINSKNEFL